MSYYRVSSCVPIRNTIDRKIVPRELVKLLSSFNNEVNISRLDIYPFDADHLIVSSVGRFSRYKDAWVEHAIALHACFAWVSFVSFQYVDRIWVSAPAIIEKKNSASVWLKSAPHIERQGLLVNERTFQVMNSVDQADNLNKTYARAYTDFIIRWSDVIHANMRVSYHGLGSLLGSALEAFGKGLAKTGLICSECAHKQQKTCP